MDFLLMLVPFYERLILCFFLLVVLNLNACYDTNTLLVCALLFQVVITWELLFAIVLKLMLTV